MISIGAGSFHAIATPHWVARYVGKPHKTWLKGIFEQSISAYYSSCQYVQSYGSHVGT